MPPRRTRETWSSGAATKQKSVRPCRQRDSPATLCPRRYYALLVIMPPLMSLRAERSNPPYPTIRDCFAPLAMTQRVFSARRPCLRRTLPLKDLRRRMREFLAEKTRRSRIIVRREETTHHRGTENEEVRMMNDELRTRFFNEMRWRIAPKGSSSFVFIIRHSAFIIFSLCLCASVVNSSSRPSRFSW